MNRRLLTAACTFALMLAAVAVSPAHADDTAADGAPVTLPAGDGPQDFPIWTDVPEQTGKPGAAPAPERITEDSEGARTLGATAAEDAVEADSGDENGLYDTVHEQINPCWEVDVWRFYAVAGQQVVIAMNRTWGNLDSFMELYNPYGELRATDDDSGGNLNARLAGTIATTGYYTIRAHSWNYQSTGGYELSVNATGGCGSCNPCGGCADGSVTVFDGPYFTGSSWTVRPGAGLSYPGTASTSIRFNGSCRGGCYVAVYRHNGWTGQTYRAETFYGDQSAISLWFDNAISYIEVYRR
jgi:hypothetical protein